MELTKNQKKLIRDHTGGAHIAIWIDECPNCVQEDLERQIASVNNERLYY